MRYLKLFLVVAINFVLLVGILGLLEFTVRKIQARKLGPGAYEPAMFMDRWTGWRNAPGFDRGDVKHNREGFRRDIEVSLDKPTNTVRVFFLGGSTAYGCEGLMPEVDPTWRRLYNKELIDAYLERMLNEKHPERRWEVINAATNEFRMHQHMMLIHAKLLAYKPDMMIFLDGHNDMTGFMAPDERYDPYAQTPHGVEFQSMVYPRSFAQLLFVNSAWLRNNSVLFSGMQRRALASMSDGVFGSGGEDRGMQVVSPVKLDDLLPSSRTRARTSLEKAGYYTRVVERLHATLAHEGVEAMFAMQPELILSNKPKTALEVKFAERMRQGSGRFITYMYENLAPQISNATMKATREWNLPFADLRGAYDNVGEQTFTDYCHLTAKGNEVVAAKLYEAMKPSIPKLVAATAAAQPAALR